MKDTLLRKYCNDCGILLIEYEGVFEGEKIVQGRIVYRNPILCYDVDGKKRCEPCRKKKNEKK